MIGATEQGQFFHGTAVRFIDGSLAGLTGWVTFCGPYTEYLRPGAVHVFYKSPWDAAGTIAYDIPISHLKRLRDEGADAEER